MDENKYVLVFTAESSDGDEYTECIGLFPSFEKAYDWAEKNAKKIRRIEGDYRECAITLTKDTVILSCFGEWKVTSLLKPTEDCNS